MKVWKTWAALTAMLLSAPALAQVDMEAFLKKDRYTSVKISPTGEYYAVTVPLEDRTALVILRRSDKQPTAKLAGAAHSVVADFWWANNERVVVSMAEKFGSEDEPHLNGELYAVNADGSRSKRLVGECAEVERLGAECSQVDGQHAAFVIDTLRNDERNVLISVMAFTSDSQTHVEKLDIYSGARSGVAAAPVRRAVFTTDDAGLVRMARGAGDDNASKLFYRDGDKTPWKLLNDENVSAHIEKGLGFSADGATAYLQIEQAQGPDAIVALDTASGKRSEILRDARVDPYAIIDSLDKHFPAGALFMSERVHSEFFDKTSATARLYRSLEKAFPQEAVEVTSVTTDGRLALLQVWSDRNPGDFYLFDTASKQADPVFSRRRWFDPAQMAVSRAIAVTARDGLVLNGYLTLPTHAGSAKPPLVVMPHGGPFEIFDEWSFDDDAQMLAQAGYAVLRINFRGSGNYGRSFTQAGARQWGRAMQDDVTDATRWAISQDIVDPARICLYGASYGAYAALMGVAREPELYRCAAGYVGVYDLPAMHKDDAGASASMRTWVNEWVGERATLSAVSPTTLVGRIKVPVFLAAGGKDERAPIAHTEKLAKALQSAGTPVETLYFATEGHGYYTEPHRREFYTRLLDFLSRQLGGAKAK